MHAQHVVECVVYNKCLLNLAVAFQLLILWGYIICNSSNDNNTPFFSTNSFLWQISISGNCSNWLSAAILWAVVYMLAPSPALLMWPPWSLQRYSFPVLLLLLPPQRAWLCGKTAVNGSSGYWYLTYLRLSLLICLFSGNQNSLSLSLCLPFCEG